MSRKSDFPIDEKSPIIRDSRLALKTLAGKWSAYG